MRRDSEGTDSELLDSLIESLMISAERPPREVEGVDEEYIADLERVSIKKVKKDDDCPICGNPFQTIHIRCSCVFPAMRVIYLISNV